MRCGLTAILAAAALAGACKVAPDAEDRHVSLPAEGRLDREPLEVLPDPPEQNSEVVALGKRIFEDPRLSSDGTVSCASCHDLPHGGADKRAFSVGAHGRAGDRNTLTVFNAGLNFLQRWDGGASSLEDQITGALTNPVDMDSTWEQALATLAADPDYRARFRQLFPDGLTIENVKKAIATFERTLVTTGSAFDRWLKGDANALSAEEKAGYETFKSVGCIACHQGRNVGGAMLQRFGVFGDYFADRGEITTADYGRFNVTNDESDRFVFRVPSLRLAVSTAPYFHDGSATTLTRAVQVMARYQLGRTLTDEQVRAIVAFLGSLAPPQGDR